MLYSIQFLCSVVATFARLVRALRKAMASVLCSPPVSVPAASSPASAAPPQLSLRRKATSSVQLAVAAAVGDVQNKRAAKEHLAAVIVPATVAVAAACSGSRCSVDVEQLETTTKAKAKAAWAARRRPSMLVIPVAPETSAPPAAAWGVAVAEKEAEVEVEGDGFCLASRRGARHSMEDGYGVVTHKIDGDSQLAFYGVYDGHGGRAAVDLVTDRLGKNVVARVLAAITSEKGDAEVSPSADAVTSAIRAAYLATDGEFLVQGTRSGSCAATALVKDGDLYVANLGDCRVVMSRDGEAVALTSDHTPADEDERMRIESTGGYVSCGSNGVWRVQDCLAVSRAFGDAGLKRWVISDPEVARLPLTAGCEFLVIASDGLWNKVSNQEAVDAVSRSNAAAAGCCKELVDMARGRGSRDDITVMVVDLKRYAR